LSAIDKDKILGNAQRFVLKGQTQKAIKEFQKLVESSPKDKRLHLKLADLYLKEEDSERATKAYLKVADLYAEEDLNLPAISIYKKVLSIDPKMLEALHKTAKLYLKEGLGGSAKSYYQSILRIRPDDQEALKALESKEILEPTKEEPRFTPKAEPHFQRHRPAPEKKAATDGPLISEPPPIELPSFSPEPEIAGTEKESEMHYHLGIAYKEMELFDYAISEFEMASSNPSIQFDCYIMLGDCFMEKGLNEKSIECYKVAAEIKGLSDEKLARLHFNLGLAYEANGMASEALHAFNLVVKLDQSISEAQERIKKLQKPHPH